MSRGYPDSIRVGLSSAYPRDILGISSGYPALSMDWVRGINREEKGYPMFDVHLNAVREIVISESALESPWNKRE